MNIIEKVRELLERFPRIAEVCGTVHVDFAEETPDSYGLASVGDLLLAEDILGNQKRQHTFLLYATYSGINDYERLCNSSALLDLALWLEEQRGAPLTEHGKAGEITSVRAENGQLIAVPNDNIADGVQYQMQIVCEYTLFD